MTPEVLVYIYAAGAAAISLWLLLRYPGRSPRSLTGAGLAVVAMFALEPAVGLAMGSTEKTLGSAAALILVAFPFFIGLFWAAACLLRSLVGLVAPLGR